MNNRMKLKKEKIKFYKALNKIKMEAVKADFIIITVPVKMPNFDMAMGVLSRFIKNINKETGKQILTISVSNTDKNCHVIHLTEEQFNKLLEEKI